MKTVFLLLVFALQSLTLVNGLVHHLTIRNDDRNVFKIETFGFITGGTVSMKLSDFSIHESKKSRSNTLDVSGKQIVNADRRLGSSSNSSLSSKPMHLGFIMRHAESESDAQQDLETAIERNQCILDKKTDRDIFLDLSNPESWKSATLEHEISSDEVGLYSLIFARCAPSGAHTISFKLDASFINPGPNYLSAGDAPLPTVYLVFFFFHLAAFIAWIWVLRRDPGQHGTVHRIHYMMACLLAFKVLSLLFESIRYHYIAMFGVSESWSIVYYFFASVKGIMLFTVILLIGSGYSLMKSYLNDNEKRIIMAVLVLQVIDNIAMVIIEETAPGSQGWLTWKDILHIVDILCCLAILMPIVWSIRHLQQAAEVDGKAQHNLVKLQIFRRFYVMVIVYIYFTRIAVYLLAATIPFYLLWLGPVATETATLIFFVVTGYQFQPAVDNPYLQVRTEDIEGREYGLDDGEDDLRSPGHIELYAWKPSSSGTSITAVNSNSI